MGFVKVSLFQKSLLERFNYRMNSYSLLISGNAELQVPPLVSQPQLVKVSSADIRQLIEEKLLVPGRSLSLMDTVGQGRVTPSLEI